jgi:3-hydroxy-9,10-secoandrosta-1,3,5(10)-triene-9,17-dione monooxygenase
LPGTAGEIAKSPITTDPSARPRNEGDGSDGDGIADGPRGNLVRQARALRSLLVGNVSRAEVERRLADETVAAVAGAGLFSMLVPRRFGGLQTDMRTVLEVTRELAQGCGSTSWVVALLNHAAWIAALGPDRLQQDVWGANPAARIACAFGGTVETHHAQGGVRVTGEWPTCSGCLHADWGVLGVPVVDAGNAVTGRGFACIPMPDLSIRDTWFVVGMRGTGSHTLVARDVFVPHHRIMSFSGLLDADYLTPHKDEAVYRTAFIPAIAGILAGPQLGLATRALELVLEDAPRRGVAATIYSRRSDSPTVQIAVARAAMLIDTAHFHAYRAIDVIDGAARAGRNLAHVERARARMDTGYVADTVREAIRLMCAANGTASFAESNPLQRIWRDCEVASSHAGVCPEINAEIYGRALLGVTQPITPLL